MLWLKEHWYAVLVVSIYLAWNVARRPPPSNKYLRVLWSFCEFFAFLPWTQLLGPVRRPGMPWPPPEPAEPSARVTEPPAPTPTDEDVPPPSPSVPPPPLPVGNGGRRA